MIALLLLSQLAFAGEAHVARTVDADGRIRVDIHAKGVSKVVGVALNDDEEADEFTPKIKCKYRKVPSSDGCNYCQEEVCTDGKTQWVGAGTRMCTLALCSLPVQREPIDSKFWRN